MIPNPFTFKGPEFLLFYTALFAAVLLAVVLLRRLFESGTVPGANALNPYQMAYLRGGKNHTIGVAALSLIDRGLLIADGSTLKSSKGDASEIARLPLEKAILHEFAAAKDAAGLYSDKAIEKEAEKIKGELADLGLIPDAVVKTQRLYLTVGSALLLVIVAGVKITIALQIQRPFLFLLVMAIIFPVVLYKLINTFRTVPGKACFDELQKTFAALKKRRGSIRMNGKTNELSILAAVFGMTMLPSAASDMVSAIHLKKTGSSGCGSSCSYGSSCSSGGCSGGCGGGCGGCG